MNRIKFSKMWDKLTKRAVGKQFTTIRGVWYEKYYREHIGDEFKIVYRGKTLGTAILEDVKKINYSDITDDFVKSDTFQDWDKNKFDEQMIKYYKQLPEEMIILTLRWVVVKNVSKQ